MPETKTTETTDRVTSSKASRFNKKRLAFLVIIILALLAGITYAITNKEPEVKPTASSKNNRKTLTSLYNAGDCDKTIDSLRNTKAESLNTEDAVALLGLRGNCYIEKRNYEAALADYTMLRDIYAKYDKSQVRGTDLKIAEIKLAIKNPPKVHDRQPDGITEEFARELEAENKQ